VNEIGPESCQKAGFAINGVGPWGYDAGALVTGTERCLSCCMCGPRVSRTWNYEFTFVAVRNFEKQN
jgi:hypothetical protein